MPRRDGSPTLTLAVTLSSNSISFIFKPTSRPTPPTSFALCDNRASAPRLISNPMLMFIHPQFPLECGVILTDVYVAYKTWGELNAARNNVIVICHPFTACADIEEWWSPLFGCGKAFDPTRFFIFCANVLGSPFGTTSPLSIDPYTGKPYGPRFPLTTLRDDVRLHKLVLDHLGITSVAAVIGGSMGGMTVLEWPLCFPGYVRCIVPMATCAKQSAWCIGWGEVQRQAIASDAAFRNGWYPPCNRPSSGLAAARMAGLLTYRTRDCYEDKFGRRLQPQAQDFSNLVRRRESASCSGKIPLSAQPSDPWHPEYAAQSYLRHNGNKFASRFDANCYIHLTHKMDTHDIARERIPPHLELNECTALSAVLSTLPPRALIISISSDGLCLPHEQKTLSDGIPDAQLFVIDSMAGHDGFLVESDRINKVVLDYMRRELSEFYQEEFDDLFEGTLDS